MNDEELERIERGDPSGCGEVVAALVFLSLVAALLVLIVMGELS